MDQPGVVKALAIGALAGLFAAGVMEAAQAGLSKVTVGRASGRDLPTRRLAGRLAARLGSRPQGDRQRRMERTVHYVTGAGLGTIYALGAWAAGPPKRNSLEARAVDSVSQLLFGLVLSGVYRATARAI